MAQARSMGQVVDESAIPLIQNPDDAVVWGSRSACSPRSSRCSSARPRTCRRAARPARTSRTGTPAAASWSGGNSGGGGGRAGRDELLADPQLRRDDGRAGHDRELAGVVRVGQVGGGGFSGGRRAAAAAGPAAASSGRPRRPAARAGSRDPGLTVHSGPMGATDTMEVFFEHLNEGDVEGAVALMDERDEMRDPRRRQRADAARRRAGRRLVPARRQGDQDGPGRRPRPRQHLAGGPHRPAARAPRSQHLDAQFRVEAGKITSINLTPFSR